MSDQERTTAPASQRDDESVDVSGTTTSRRRFLEVLALGSAGATAGLAAPFVTGAAAEAAPLRPGGEPTARTRANYRLFSEGRIGSMRLKNRFVRSAAHEGRAQNEFVSDEMIRLHEGFARGGVGLALTGYMAVMQYGTAPSRIGAYDDKFIPGLTRLAKAVHDVGPDTRLGAQIGHDGTGRPGLSPDGVQWPNRIGPSGLDWDGNTGAHVMTVAEIERYCADMGRAAYRLQQAGFDCVQIHGAHRYLINTFTSPWTNRRTDEWGGSLENRTRIVRRIVEEMRDRTGPDFPILIKVNCVDTLDGEEHPVEGAIDIRTFPAFAKAIEAAGVDAIDISRWDPMTRLSTLPQPYRLRDQSYNWQYAEALDLNIPVILGNGNRHVDMLEHLFVQGTADFVSFARPLIREPELVNRWLEGRGGPRSLCTDTSACFPSHNCAVLAAMAEQFTPPEVLAP
jgi:2,4-dienoyl-CoA reductase-like NADH-dependent reductase (Old Yellow Enzyme family)